MIFTRLPLGSFGRFSNLGRSARSRGELPADLAEIAHRWVRSVRFAEHPRPSPCLAGFVPSFFLSWSWHSHAVVSGRITLHVAPGHLGAQSLRGDYGTSRRLRPLATRGFRVYGPRLESW